MWKDLTLSQKADIIKTAVKAGLRDMKSIRDFYDNSLKYADGGPKKSFDDWYKTVPVDRNDTTNYDLRRAYELAPIEDLESWRTSSIEDLRNGKNHLRSVYEDPNTGIYNFVKSKNHPTVGLELDWYNSKDAADFRSKYDLDTSGDYYRYVPKPDYNITLPEVTVLGRKKAYGGSLDYPAFMPNQYGNGGIMDGIKSFFGFEEKPKPKRKVVYKSLTGKVFNTMQEAIKDNTEAKRGLGIYADKNIEHTVVNGDSLWKIAQMYNTDVASLERLNPTIKNSNIIHTGDKIVVGKQKGQSLKNIKKEWEKEAKLNTDNMSAIQGVEHSDNYVVIDKLNGKLSVFNPDNTLLYSTDIATGKSGNDYNTITYVNKNGKIISGKGNESTPAGITKITGTGVYHGFPSFTRGRVSADGVENIASSLHFGSTKNKKMSNGCVRMDGKALQELSNYVGVGTSVYTLPEKAGSRFTVKDGKLNFTADNPYGKTEGSKKYWDDYNVYTDKSYTPLSIVSKSKSKDTDYNKNVSRYIRTLENSKQRIQTKFNLDSDTYNRLANIALGIAEQESKFGTSSRYKLKQNIPDSLLSVAKTFRGGQSARSRGITQIKMEGDNKGMRDIYNELGITANNIYDIDKSALATVARLAYMYNTEVRGRKFTGEEGEEISPYDALLYKWNGHSEQLTNHTATPNSNIYINNVNRYANNFDLYSLRAKALGGHLYAGGQTLGKYVLPVNTLDSYGDVAQFITDPSASNALELGASIVGKKYNDYTKKGRQLYELGTQGLNAYNTFK